MLEQHEGTSDSEENGEQINDQFEEDCDAANDQFERDFYKERAKYEASRIPERRVNPVPYDDESGQDELVKELMPKRTYALPRSYDEFLEILEDSEMKNEPIF